MRTKVCLFVGAAALLVCLFLANGTAQEASNLPAGKLGAPAAPLDGLQWIKGDPVQLQEGSVYVVEFWATWCGPCRVSIPHLTELQSEYKDKGVSIIGISDETADLVKPFVENMAEKMDYTVAIDPQQRVSGAYMGAVGVGTIPHAFIVDKSGSLVWHGHPMIGMDEVLAQVVAGEFDHVAYAQQKAEEEERQARVVGLYRSYFAALGTDPEEAKSPGHELLTLCDDAAILNSFSWRILTDVAENQRDLELARDAAAKAMELTEGNNASVLDTYALALYELGKQYVAQAVAYQKRAVELVDDEQALATLKKALERYESASVE
jgi:thiol-disulfide isomerase/thioredoxin